MPDSSSARYDSSIGRRIQAIRKQRGLTQHGLAQRAHISYSCLSKVEAGHLAASPAVTAACARALRVPVTDLTGQPYLDNLRQDQFEEVVQPIRHALATPRAQSGADGRPRSLEEIRRDLAHLEESRLQGRYMPIGTNIPGLLGELIRAAEDAPPGAERERTHHALAIAYWLARYFAHMLGFIDLGLLALERMELAIQHADDPWLSAVVCHNRCDYLIHHGAYDIGLQEIGRMERLLEDPAHRGDVRALSALGSMHLKAAVIHSRQRKPTSASDVRSRIAEARRAAAQTAGHPDPYGLVFDRVNVDVHGTSTRLDLGDVGHALAQGEEVRFPAGWAGSRMGHHHLDMARAYEKAGRRPEALHALHEAREAATPAYVRYHPTTRETTLALLRGRGTPAVELRRFARWVGV